MFRNRIANLALCLGVLLGTVFVSRPAQAASITLSGTIGTDDAVQLFDFTVAAAGSVDLRSYGYAGGTTSTGTVAPSGGFDTILTLFDSSGNFLSENDDGAGVATDPSTGLAADARITQNLTAGSYILALTEYDNFSNGNLADGFVETGNPNFTADPSFTTGGSCPGNLFRDISGTAGRCRNGNWTVDFVNVASVTPVAPVPEPAALLLAGLGLALLLASRCRRRRTAPLLVGGFVAVLASVPVQAQTNCPPVTSGPDFCHVSDFLNGQRTLLQVQDLQVYWSAPNLGAGTINIQTSNSAQTQVSDSQISVPYDVNLSRTPQLFSARIFNQPSPITISPLYPVSSGWQFRLYLHGIPNLPDVYWTPFAAGDFPDLNCGAAADFRGDGYEELALGFGDGRILVLGANDPNDVSKGYQDSVATLNLLLDMTAGDFNGDGRPELAGLTVVPYDQPGGGGLVLVIYTVDPQSLAVTTVSKLTLTTPGASASNPITRASIMRGRFNSAGHDQLAVAFTTPAGPPRVEVIDFDPNTLNAHEAPALTPTPQVGFPFGLIQVKTGKFDLPTNPYDQIVYHSSSPNDGGRFFEVLSVDPGNLMLQAHAPITYNDYPGAVGIQVGNFDHRQPDPSHPGQTQPNPNDQIAFLYDYYVESNVLQWALSIYNVDPGSLNVSNPPASASQIAITDLQDPGGNTAAFVATDLQGRSITLGEPTKIAIQNTVQPTVALGVPPMHVDFISPDPHDNVPATVFNVSAIPDGFKTSYQQQNSDSADSSTTNSTSWSWGSKESFSGGYTIGNPKVDGTKLKDTFTAAQNLKGEGGNTYNTYQGKTFGVTATVGLGDEVTYVADNFNIWVYPVLGQTVCSTKITDSCQPVPLTIQYSAPDGDANTTYVQGQLLQWYQPPWEPGNIFSYPANYRQLLTIYPNLSQLTNPITFDTDAGTVTQSTKWSVSTLHTGTTSMNQNYSFENDLSVNGSFGVPAYTLNYGLDIDLSGSFGFNTLTKNTTTLGESTGIEISKPGTFATPGNYAYSVAPYLMGTTQQGGMVDNQPLSGNVQTFGLLRAMFTADPLTNTSGAWWPQAYGQVPDVALNHPLRWSVTASGAKDPLPSNCLAVGDNKSMDCAYIQPPLPNNPALDDFHRLRGFFISSNNSPGQGPQLEQAKAGDVLYLQTRVYNYSLKDMDDDTEVHVRFYFMPWDTNAQLPAGDSVLINEVTAPPIPKFDHTLSSDGTPAKLNWVLVPTTFDTSKFDQTKDGNVSVVFWVLVWMQDHNGNKKAEISGHGLQGTGIPGTLTSFAEAVKLDEIVLNGNTAQDYSNNLGIYKPPFYIASHSLGAVPGPLPGPAELDIGKVELSANQVRLGSNVVVSAMLSASGADATSLDAKFYEGDPNQGGQPIDVQRIPYIAQENPYKVQTSYQANTCGTHELFVVINGGQSNEVVRRAPPVRVDCNP